MLDELYLQVDGSTLKSLLPAHLVQGGREQYGGRIVLDEAWQAKTCVACFAFGDANLQTPIVEGRFAVPDEAVSAGRFTLGILGVEEDSTYVTNLLYFSPAPGATQGDNPDTPTPTLWEAYLVEVADLVEEARVAALGKPGVGIVSVVKTAAVGLVDTYTITMTDNTTTTFQVTNGANGVDGADGTDGINGVDGADGADGTNGIDGINGTDGIDGQDGLTTSITLNGETKTQVGGNIDLGDLATASYVTQLVGDINDVLDAVNGEVI